MDPWISNDGRQHVNLGRIVYFLVVSACLCLDCPQRQLARVEWFTDPTGKYISEIIGGCLFVSVSLCPSSSKQRYSRVAYVRKRAKGPFMALTLENTKWGYEQHPQWSKILKDSILAKFLICARY